eukprot:11659302-Alexandrium_andersonii.AAC.1
MRGRPPSVGGVCVSLSTTCPTSWGNASKCIASSSTLSRRSSPNAKVGAPFADDVKKSVLERGGHCA